MTVEMNVTPAATDSIRVYIVNNLDVLGKILRVKLRSHLVFKLKGAFAAVLLPFGKFLPFLTF